MLQNFIDEVSEAVFPSNIYCEICGALIDRSRPYSLCDKCVRKMHWITGRTCVKCGKALPETYRGNICYDCMELKHCFIRGWSCLAYGFYERELMMSIKYGGKGYLALKMGDVLFDRMETLIEEAEEKEIKPFDIVVPVPISKSRLAARGYNQSELMARQMMKRWRAYYKSKQSASGRNRSGQCRSAGLPVLNTKVLFRQKDTEMLRSLNPAERRLALRDAFGVKSVGRKTILLIDDIYTTGATADACSKVLLDGGAEAVYLLTLCSGGNRKPEIDNT